MIRLAFDATRGGARPAFTRLAALDPTPLALYEQTLASYVERVAPRARAVYQVGRVRGDGLSDLDLIVVPGEPRFDDGLFYSARVRVRGARRLFPHDARPLPLAVRDAIGFTSHADRRLVSGEDVLADVPQALGREQDLALLLEGFLKYARFVENTARAGRVPAERLVSKATSLSYSLALFDRLTGECSAPPYMTAVLALRSRLAREPARREWLLAELWDAFAAPFAALDRGLAKRLPCANGESVSQFARAFLVGQRAVAGLDAAVLAARRATVARYHDELERSGFFQGSLFAKGAYGAAQGGARGRRPNRARRALGLCAAPGYWLGARG